MKLVLVASLAAVLGMGVSGKAEAHGYPPPAGGSIYWADDNVVIGFNYGVPIVRPYYVPPRYGYSPRVYRHAYRHGKHHGHYKGYSKGYRKGYYKGHKRGHRDDRHDRHDRRGRHGHGRDRWDD